MAPPRDPQRLIEELVRATDTVEAYWHSAYFKSAVTTLAHLLVPMVQGIAAQAVAEQRRFEQALAMVDGRHWPSGVDAVVFDGLCESCFETWAVKAVNTGDRSWRVCHRCAERLEAEDDE